MSTYEVTQIHSTDQKETLLETFTSKAKAQAYCKAVVKSLRPTHGAVSMPKNDLFAAKFNGWAVTYHINKVA